MSKITHRVLVSIDSLFDVRLAILAKLDVEVASKLLAADTWHDRNSQNIKSLDPALADVDWDAAWNNRTIDDLKTANSTYIPRVIGDLAKRYKDEGPRMGLDGSVELTINTFPYSIDEESRGAIRDIMKIQYGCSSVNFASLELGNYTLPMIYNYDTVVLDDLNEWVEIHNGTFKPTGLARTQVYCPLALKKDSPPLPLDMMATAIRYEFQSLFVLEPLPIKLFSIIHASDLVRDTA